MLYDEESREFKMWYGTYLSDKAAPSGLRYRVCYATSKDGIHWVRPDLGEVEWEGSRKNNLIKWGVQWMRRPNVIKDLHDPDPSRRYKMTYVDVFDGKTAITKAFSADGIRWQLNADGKPWFRMNHGANLLGWDPRVERYVIFTKMPGSQDSMGRATSTDFLNWSDPQTVLAPGATERNANFKGLTAFSYGDIYLGFLYNFERQPDGFLVSQAELAMSRDGVKWQRVAPGEPCFRLGSKGSWESHGVFPVAPVIHKDRIMVFYCAWNVPYGDDHEAGEAGWVENGMRKQYAIGLATLRLDGFVSLEAGPRPGSVTTKTVELAGGTLEVNADVRGDLRVELLDAAERPLEGYSAADCEPVRSDSLRHISGGKRSRVSSRCAEGRPGCASSCGMGPSTPFSLSAKNLDWCRMAHRNRQRDPYRNRPAACRPHSTAARQHESPDQDPGGVNLRLGWLWVAWTGFKGYFSRHNASAYPRLEC